MLQWFLARIGWEKQQESLVAVLAMIPAIDLGKEFATAFTTPSAKVLRRVGF